MNASTVGFIEPAAFDMAGQAVPPKRHSRRVAMDVVAVLDVTAVVVGAILPAWIYAIAGGLDINPVIVAKSALVTAMLFFICMQAWKMYDLSKLNDLPVYPSRLLAALIIATFAALGIGIPFNVGEVHLWIWYAAWISASFVGILSVRLISRHVLAKMVADGRFDMRVAVFGAGEIARRVQEHLKSPKAGVHFVGVYDDRPRDRLDADGLDIKGRLDELLVAGRSGAIDQIVIALPQSADRRLAIIANKLQQLPVSIHMVTHISSDLVESGPAHKVSALGGVGLLDVKDKPLTDWAPLAKRVEDVVLGGMLLVLALPLMALIMLGIKLDSRGPVLVRQRRRGLNLAVIDVLKFRTARLPEDGQVAPLGPQAEQVTAFGRVLRRFGLDNLPQLFNVLKGEMSLVGPRPQAIANDEQLGDDVQTFGIRHQMKPGMTGLSQVEGWQDKSADENDAEARVRDVLAYIRSWSLGTDFSIISRSLGAALLGRKVC